MAGNEVMVWHYTRRDFLEAIAECEELRPSNRHGLYTLPLLWFSAQQQWEHQATQCGDLSRRWDMSKPSSIPWQRTATEHEAIRFGLPAADPRLLNWRQTCIASGMNREMRKHIEKLAKVMKSDAGKWLVTTVPIPLGDLCYQVWYQGSWCNADDVIKFLEGVINGND